MTPFVEGLARKWFDGCLHNATEFENYGPCVGCFAAAIREALEEADRIGNELWNKYADDQRWGAAQQAAITEFRVRIAALRETA